MIFPGFSGPYGLLYALEPSESVARFVNAVKEKAGKIKQQ